MRTDIPLSQVYDSHQLESKGLRDLFKVELNDADHSVLYLTPHNQLQYMGHLWQEWPVTITGIAQNSSGEQSRPKFSAANPDAIFSQYADQGILEGSIVTRYRVLLSDIEADVRAYVRMLWTLSKIVTLNRNLLVTELRSTLDGPNFRIPARQFYPPAFPAVSLR